MTDDAHVDKINTLVRANRRLTIKELVEECGISVESCDVILTTKIEDASRHCDICATPDDRVDVFVAKHSITVLPHPTYLPDLAPYDFFLFPKLKKPLKGRRFETI